MTAIAYKQERWSLTDLFPAFDSEEVKTAFSDLEDMLSAFESKRENLEGISSEGFVAMLNDYEAITRLINRLMYFAHLSFAADTQDQQAQSFLAQGQQLAAQAENRILFFKLWWKGLNDEAAESLLEASGDYRYWLEALRLQKPYTLSEAEEKVINLKDVNGPSALITLYDAITNRYTFRMEVDGEVKELTRGELMVFARSANADLRAAAYQEQLRVYGEDAPILGQMYQYIVRDWRSEGVDLRGYGSPIAIRNLGNDIPDDVVDILLDVCKKNAPLFQHYFALKAKWLGVDKIRRYDVYAPVAESDKTYSFEEAAEMVLASYNAFEPIVADHAETIFKTRHIDSEVRKGKRGGAFCATATPSLAPWVLISYQGRPDSVATLAHELGHAVHSLLAGDHTALTQHSCLPLAETASTFGEMLLMDYMLATDPDEDLQRDLLFKQMDDAYATIMRQAYFAIFERDAHEKVKAGASVDELSELYLQNLKDQFGDSLELSDDFRYEWVVIPHIFHTPFYVYAYAFGQLLVLSLYQQYRQEGEGFKPRYLDLLRAGGSKAPMQILDEAGINVRTPAFWQGGFDVLAAALEKLEQIDIPA